MIKREGHPHALAHKAREFAERRICSGDGKHLERSPNALWELTVRD